MALECKFSDIGTNMEKGGKLANAAKNHAKRLKRSQSKDTEDTAGENFRTIRRVDAHQTEPVFGTSAVRCFDVYRTL